MGQSKRQKYETLKAQMELERSSFIPHWRDLCENILPRRGRFFLEDVNRGERRNSKIIDSTATLACRTLQSGMMSGITSPARTWKKLTTPDPDLADYPSVKEWLHIVDSRMDSVFLKSNLYQKTPTLYGDLGTFATGAISIEEDFDDVIRANSFPIGSYSIATDFRGRVNTFFREFRMTVQQVVDQFGKNEGQTGKADWSMFSDYVRQQYERGNYQTWIDVCHLIYPNPEYDPKRLSSKFKKYASIYYERGSQKNSNYDDERMLRESGYDMFPIMVPRWEVTGEDTYGTNCPGMTCLGDIKALQLMQKRKSQAIEKMVNPAMKGPTSMENIKSSILPGDMTYVDERGDMQFRPVHEVNINLGDLRLDIQDHQQRIRTSYFEDLFLMFAQSDRRQITAREIDERSQEKLLAIGPVLEQLNQDFLNPLVDTTFEYMLKQGMIPPAPPELQGVNLKVEYVSVMAQAQKMVALSGVERFARFTGELLAVAPQVANKVNFFEMMNVYGEMTSIPPKILVSDDDAIAAQQAQQQAAAAQQKSEMMMNAASSAKTLSETSTEGDNALTALLGAGRQ